MLKRVLYIVVTAVFYGAKTMLQHILYKNLEIQICKSVILLVVLLGFETWFLTLREGHRFRVLRSEFGLKSRSVERGWWMTILHNAVELCNFYSTCFPLILYDLSLMSHSNIW
jgi:hypothetical protein